VGHFLSPDAKGLPFRDRSFTSPSRYTLGIVLHFFGLFIPSSCSDSLDVLIQRAFALFFLQSKGCAFPPESFPFWLLDGLFCPPFFFSCMTTFLPKSWGFRSFFSYSDLTAGRSSPFIFPDFYRCAPRHLLSSASVMNRLYPHTRPV